MVQRPRISPRALALPLALIFAAAGCVEDSTNEADPTRPSTAHCESAACQPEPANETASSVLTGSRCELFQSLVLTEKTVFAPTYPPSVTGFHSNVVSAAFNVLGCREFASNASVLKDVQLGFLTTLVRPPPGGAENVSNVYVHQAYSNSADLANMLRDSFGFETTVMSTVNMLVTPTPAGAKRIEYDLPTQAPAYSLRGFVDAQGDHPARDVYAHVYAGPQGLHQFVTTTSGKETTSSPGVLLFGPSSYWASHSRVPVFATTQVHQFDATVTLSFDVLQVPAL